MKKLIIWKSFLIFEINEGFFSCNWVHSLSSVSVRSSEKNVNQLLSCIFFPFLSFYTPYGRDIQMNILYFVWRHTVRNHPIYYDHCHVPSIFRVPPILSLDEIWTNERKAGHVALNSYITLADMLLSCYLYYIIIDWFIKNSLHNKSN